MRQRKGEDNKWIKKWKKKSSVRKGVRGVRNVYPAASYLLLLDGKSFLARPEAHFSLVARMHSANTSAVAIRKAIRMGDRLAVYDAKCRGRCSGAQEVLWTSSPSAADGDDRVKRGQQRGCDRSLGELVRAHSSPSLAFERSTPWHPPQDRGRARTPCDLLYGILGMTCGLSQTGVLFVIFIPFPIFISIKIMNGDL